MTRKEYSASAGSTSIISRAILTRASEQYHSMQQQHPEHGYAVIPVSNQPLHQDFGSSRWSRGLARFANRPGGSGADGGRGYADFHQRTRPAESSGYVPSQCESHDTSPRGWASSSSPAVPSLGLLLSTQAQSPAGAAVPHRREDRGAESPFSGNWHGEDCDTAWMALL